jgi:3-(3-hydroxy-phenyl)propionate hydroxylase
MSRPRETPVLVVGRGPVGMTLALRLAGLGVASTIVDPLGSALDPGSKALLMAGEALEVLERVGCGRAIAERGTVLASGRTFYRDRDLVTVRFADAGPGFPPVVNFPQADTERLLLDRVEREPLVERRWGERVIDVEQDAAGVTCRLAGPRGEAAVHARYVAGCDGVRSTLRKRLGIPFEGGGFADRFLITDIRAELPFPRDERRFFFDPPFNRGRTVLVHPQPGSAWHIDWQVGREVDVEQEQQSGRLDARLRELVGSAEYELVWVTAYRFLQLIARRFSTGRAFLLGDAAHVYSPYGARGLNSGLVDADNLAWKLALVMAGRAPESLLATYESERRPVAEENLRVTAATARFMAPPTRVRRLARDAVLAASARVSPLRRLVNSGRFYAPPVYAGSSIVAPGCGEVVADTVLPDGRRVRDLLGREFVGLLALRREEAVAANAGGVPFRLVPFVERKESDAWGRLTVVRPDGHVASRHELHSSAGLAGVTSWLRAAAGHGREEGGSNDVDR